MKTFFYSILILIVLLSLYFGYIIGTNKLSSYRAMQMGSTYIKDMYAEYSVLGKSCQGKDTNGDSYISCDFRLKSGEKETVINIQCPIFWDSFLGTSCKENRININQVLN